MAGTYFHVAPLPLGPGSIIRPGNWGRIKRTIEGNSASIAREAVLELVRIRDFGSLPPSRLNCCFACPSLEHAVAYRQLHAPANLIYEVTTVDHDPPVHVGDHQMVLEGYIGMDGMATIARRYWEKSDKPFPEVLIGSPIRVIKEVL